MKTRKLLAIMLAIAVLASFISVPVFAEGEGTALETLGILIGPDEDGVTPEYLATIATRAQAALIDLRLEGNEAAALAFDGEETFTDAADATEFWQPILEFLKATPASGWNGYEDGSFAPNAPITGMEFTKILLVSLGYVEGVDFMYADVMDFAATVGLIALAEKADADLTVEDLAVAIIEALGTKTTAATDVTLLTQLVLDGVIDEADALAAGFVIDVEAFVIVDAYASSVNEVTVEMSTDVPAGAVVTLKKGTAAYSVSEAVVGDTITLTALFNLPAGTYTVTVDGSSADFEVMAQYAVELVLTADTVFLDINQDLGVSMFDQYGELMSLSGTNYSVFNQNDGYVYDPDVDDAIEIDVEDDSAAEAGDVIFVFVYDPVSMLTVSGELPVIAAPVVTTLTVGAVTPSGTDVTTLFQDTDDNVLAVTVYDQYGDAMTLTDSLFDTQIPSLYDAEIQVLSSNGNVIDAENWDVIGGVFTFDADDPGMALFTFIIPAQAFIATSEMITVYATPALATIQTAGPDEAVYADEETDFAVTGFDQYGDPFDVAAGVTFTSTVQLFGDPSTIENSAANVISLTADMDGTATVYYFLGGIFQGTFDVTVNEAAYPFQITGVDAFMAMEEGTNQEILSEDIEVIDQYGRVMTAPFDGTGFTWNAMSAAATDLFSTSPGWVDGYLWVGADTGTTDATGSETFVAKLIDLNDGYKVMTESAFSFAITNVETEDVEGFEMALTAGTMYTGATFDFGQTADEYYKYVTVTGTYGGVKVLLNLDSNGVPELIDVITSTNDHVEVMSGDILVPTTADDTTTNIKAWRNGVAVANADQDLSKVDPDCVVITAEADDSVDTVDTGDYAVMFTYTDQYGVDLDYALLQASRASGVDPTVYFFTSNDTVGDYTYYYVVKWDGSLSEVYVDKDTTLTPAP